MKLVFSFIAISCFMFSSYAQAKLIEKGCYEAQDRKYGTYTVVISIYSKNVNIDYVSSKHGNLGSYKGTIISSTNFKKTASGVTVKNITLNDGADGFIDDVKIIINQETITFDSKNSIEGTHPRIDCH